MYYRPRPLCAASRREIHSEPAWSVRPCAMIETSKQSAAMLKTRSASGTPEPSTKSANAIVATPFGPNHDMNAFSGVPTPRLPTSATNTATGRAASSVNSDGHGRRAVLEQPVQREDRAEHQEDGQLHELDHLLGLGLEALGDVRPPDAEHDGGREHGDQPVPLRRERRDAVGRERHPDRVEGLLMRADLIAERPPAWV